MFSFYRNILKYGNHNTHRPCRVRVPCHLISSVLFMTEIPAFPDTAKTRRTKRLFFAGKMNAFRKLYTEQDIFIFQSFNY